MYNYEEYSRGSQPNKRSRGLRNTALALGLCALAHITLDNIELAKEETHVRLDASDLDISASKVVSIALGETVRLDCDSTRVAQQSNAPKDQEAMAYVRSFNVTFPLLGTIYESHPNTMHVQERVCRDLASLEDSPTLSVGAAYGLYVTAHEMEHIDGTADEAAASCYAAQKMPAIYQRLGMRPEEAYYAAEYTVGAVRANIASTYLTPLCQPGTELDLGTGGPYLTPR